MITNLKAQIIYNQFIYNCRYHNYKKLPMFRSAVCITENGNKNKDKKNWRLTFNYTSAN